MNSRPPSFDWRRGSRDLMSVGGGSCYTADGQRKVLAEEMRAMHSPLTISEEELRAFCERWRIVELEVFGSAMRPDFSPDSDIDLLVTYAPEARWTLFDEARMQEELELLLSRSVDIVSRRAIEDSPNWIRRKSILESAERIYAATE